MQVFAEAEAVVLEYLHSSSYHFVPHGIFDYVKRVNELAGVRVESTAGGKRGAGRRSAAATGGAPAELKRARVDPASEVSAAGVSAGMMGLQED